MLFDDQNTIVTCGLLLSPEQEQTAVQLSQKIAANQTASLTFTLDTETQPPYIRLYEVLIPADNQAKATQVISGLAKEMIPMHLPWGMLEVTENLIAVWAEVPPALEAFHKAILLEMQQIREGYHKEKYSKYITEQLFTPEEVVSIKKWGSPWADPFVPHLVIAKTEQNFLDAELQLEWPHHTCVSPGLFLGFRTEKHHFQQVLRLPFSHQ